MKTVKVTIGAPSLYHIKNDAERDNKVEELRHELASHFFTLGIHEGQLDGSDLSRYGGDVRVICTDKIAMRLILTIGMYEHSKMGVKSVEELYDTEETSYDRMLEKLELAAARLTEEASCMRTAGDAVLGADKYNAHTMSHLTGNTLSSYNSLRLLEDCCTDVLQGALDDGWRIVACCPQEQRRPDYILGRYDPHHSPDLRKGAAR